MDWRGVNKRLTPDVPVYSDVAEHEVESKEVAQQQLRHVVLRVDQGLEVVVRHVARDVD